MSDENRALAHVVFFKLKQSDEASRDALVAACQEHLNDHPGTVHFSAGARAVEFTRPVNDSEYDVALHVVFESGDAHDAYQASDRHQQFLAENKSGWDQIRVFDSWV